jgi:hypothetical protein
MSNIGTMNNSSSSLKTINLEGQAPWGFRIMNEPDSVDSTSNILPSLLISKV